MSVIVGRVLAGGMPAGKAPPSDRPLADLTVRELEAICDEMGIKLPARARKADIVQAIEAHRGRAS